MYTIENLNKKNNNELLAIINESADKAEHFRLKSIEMLDKMDEQEKIYVMSLECLNNRINPVT